MLSVDIGAVIVFIIVWILLVVLTRIFFNPIRKVIQDRNQVLKTNREREEKAITDYENTVKKIEDDIKAAKIAAIATKTMLEKEALQEKERILNEVSQQCREQVQAAQQELGREMKKLKDELESESERLAEKIEKRLLN